MFEGPFGIIVGKLPQRSRYKWVPFLAVSACVGIAPLTAIAVDVERLWNGKNIPGDGHNSAI